MRGALVTLVSSSVIAQIATIAMLPVLARIYGPEPFGDYAIYVALTALLAIVGTLRYEMAIVLPRSRREAAAILRMSIRLLSVISLTVTAVGCLLGFIEGWTTPRAFQMMLVGPGVFLLGFTGLMIQWLTRAGEFRTIGRSRVLQSLASGLSQIAFGSAFQNGAGLVAGLLFGQAVSVLYLVRSGEFSHVLRATATDHRWIYLLRKYGRLPAILAPQTLVDSIRLNGVNILLGNFSVGALGQYSQASRLVQLPVGLIGSAVSQVFFPRLANEAKKNLFAVVLKCTVRSALLGAVPFALIGWLSPVVFPLILGEEWAQSGRFAQALVPSLYLILISSPISTVFIVLRKEYIGLAYSLVYAALTLGTLMIFAADLMHAVWAMSLVQAWASGVYIGLALLLSRQAGKVRRVARA